MTTPDFKAIATHHRAIADLLDPPAPVVPGPPVVQPPPAPATPPAPVDTTGLPVTRAGTALLLAGRPYRVIGANVYDLLDDTPTEATQRLTELAALGINTVRTWAFSKDGTAGAALLARLDAALAAARPLGIRLLLSLGNQWNDWGGPASFGLTQDTWFRAVNPSWLAQARAIAAHVQGSPTVLALELLNEPRPNMDSTSMGWLGSVSSQLKAVDSARLICSGSEGFVPPAYPTPTAQSSASPDVSMANLNAAAAIDICSGHIYSKYLTPNFAPDAGLELAALTAMKAAADQLGKPLILGEVGFDPTDFGGLPARAAFLHSVAAESRQLGIAGACIWNYGRPPASSFTLAPGDAGSTAVLADWVASLH